MPELTDAQIEDQFGTLFEEALHAFRTDSGYVVTIGEAAGRWKRRGLLSRVQADAEPESETQEALPLVEEIDRRRAAGESIASIAEALWVSESTVKRLGTTTRRKPNPQLSDEEREERNSKVRELAKAGLSMSAIAQETDLSRAGVRNVLAEGEPILPT